MVIPKSEKNIQKSTGKFVYSKVNSIIQDFGMWLFQYKKVNQHENHHSGTWGDAEQESGGVCRKLFFLFFFMHF